MLAIPELTPADCSRQMQQPTGTHGRQCLRHTNDIIQIGLGELISKQESTCEHFVDSKSSKNIVLDNSNIFSAL